MMPEKATVKLSDLLDAFVWVCAGAIGDNGAFICRETAMRWTPGINTKTRRPKRH